MRPKLDINEEREQLICRSSVIFNDPELIDQLMMNGYSYVQNDDKGLLITSFVQRAVYNMVKTSGSEFITSVNSDLLDIYFEQLKIDAANTQNELETNELLELKAEILRTKVIQDAKSSLLRSQYEGFNQPQTTCMHAFSYLKPIENSN